MEKKPKVILGADLGIRLDTITPNQREYLESQLTAKSIAWKNNPVTTVVGYYEQDGYLWVPRQFGLSQGFEPDLDIREPGLPQDLEFKATLDPARGQVNAVRDMVNYLRKNGGGILISPTGSGKTLQSYAIASHFNTSIGILVYAGHMVDNWIAQANLAFGLKPDQIGLVQQDECTLGKPITIIFIQSLLSRKYPEELYKQIGFIIVDETQRFGSTMWSKVIGQFPAMYRLSMTADKARKDGLDEVIKWNFGNVGHTVTKRTVVLTVTKIHVDVDYSFNSYKDWRQSALLGRDVGDSMRYDKQLAKDSRRNQEIVKLLLQARKIGRKIIVFSRLRDHLDSLKAMFDKQIKTQSNYPETISDFLVGGMKKAQREEAMKADIKFSTYAYARDALNDTSLDTMFFATPPGDPLQPAGRLRDKGSPDRHPLQLVDFHESNDYSTQKWFRRHKTYNQLGFTVKEFVKKPE
jgi:Type III restriction enzyme, res subunit